MIALTPMRVQDFCTRVLGHEALRPDFTAEVAKILADHDACGRLCPRNPCCPNNRPPASKLTDPTPGSSA